MLIEPTILVLPSHLALASIGNAVYCYNQAATNKNPTLRLTCKNTHDRLVLALTITNATNQRIVIARPSQGLTCQPVVIRGNAERVTTKDLDIHPGMDVIGPNACITVKLNISSWFNAKNGLAGTKIQVAYDDSWILDPMSRRVAGVNVSNYKVVGKVLSNSIELH